MTDDSNLRYAKLETIYFSKLLERDEETVSRMVRVCTDTGFFYLDLTTWGGGELIQTLDSCNRVVEKWFCEQPLEEKRKTVTVSDAHGYKEVGQQSGVREGERDGYESLRLSRTAQLTREPLPEVVLSNLDDFDRLHFGSHFVVKTILCRLSEALAFLGEKKDVAKAKAEAEANFETSHQDAMQSRSALYFLHHPPKPAAGKHLGQNVHTDAGTLTLLFTQQPGLQVLSPEGKEWERVRTKPGHGIVNVGDTLRFLSGERFRSALHRVMPDTDGVGGAQRYDRYSTAYFLRAADEAIFVGHDGKTTTAEEWFQRKFRSFTLDRSAQRVDSVAFGGMEKVLGTSV